MSKFYLPPNTDNERIIGNIGRTIRALDPSKKWQVTIKLFRKDRSLAQNAFYWGPFLGAVVDWYVESRGIRPTKKGIHEEFKKLYCPEVREVGLHGEHRTYKSTADLTTKEFNDMLDEISADMGAMGIAMPLPDPDWKKNVRSKQVEKAA